MKKKLISGILATMFLVTMVTVALPARVSADWYVGTVKLGIVGPKGWIQWDGLWEAAQFGADYINKDAEFSTRPGYRGIMGPGGAYKVVLVDIDEHAVPAPDPAAAIAELLTKLDANPDMSGLIGGFRTEVVQPMEEAFCDYQAVNNRQTWTISGAATDALITVVKTNYARYKYMFRATPMNSTNLFQQFLFGPIKQLIAPKLAQLYGTPVPPAGGVPAYVIAENLVWADGMVSGCTYYSSAATGYASGLDVKGNRRPSAVATDFSADIAAATGAGAKVVIHIFSSVAGANFIKQVGALQPKFTCIGINVESQMQQFYASVGGACEYESFLASVGTQVGVAPMNPAAKPLTSTEFWAKYEARYGHSPIYTAWGAYDAIIGLNETSYDPVSGKGWLPELLAGDINARIQHTESLGISDGFASKRVLGYGGNYYRSGLLSLFKYTGVDGIYHDLFVAPDALGPTWPTKVSRSIIPQWQAGRLNPLWPRDMDASRKWIIPTWMYSLETDFAGGPAAGIYATPDLIVSLPDLQAATAPGVWFSAPPLNLLEADMTPQDHFIESYDLGKIGKDWLKVGVPA